MEICGSIGIVTYLEVLDFRVVYGVMLLELGAIVCALTLLWGSAEELDNVLGLRLW